MVVTGVTILVEIGTVSWRLESRLDAQRRELRTELKDGFADVRKRLDALDSEFTARLDAQGREVGGLRERMARLEGLLEVLRDAITGKRAA